MVGRGEQMAPQLHHLSSSEEQRPVSNSLWRVLRHNTHWKCLILTTLIVGCLAAIAWCRLAEVTKIVVTYADFDITSAQRSSPCNDGYLYIPVAVVVTVYLVYLVECWHCSTRLQLRHRTDVASVYQRLQQMWDAQPLVWWKAICYHYVRRTRQVTHYRNGSAYTSTQIYYERVDSHSTGATFVYAHCGVRDISKRLVDLERHPAIKVRLSKGFAFTNVDAAAEFEEQRARFFQDNEHRDDYMEMREGLELTNVHFREFTVAFADADHLPWYISHPVFWAASFLLLSWPLRMLVETRTAYVHHHITKLFGVNYVVAGATPPATLQRADSVTPTAELERHVCNNLHLAPSYSEALLMVAANGPGNAPTHHVPCTTTTASNGGGVQEQQLCSSRAGRRKGYHRHSWALVGSRYSHSEGFPPSITRCSLYNGHMLYLPSALWECPGRAAALVHKPPRLAKLLPPLSSTISLYCPPPSDNPPDYDVAIRVSWPIQNGSTPMRRSHTDRAIWPRAGDDDITLATDETAL